ncbi:MAG: glutamate synthase large subunit [Nitrospina sp.]|jgi:glutamate synthase (NADPH) large chain|nr:glutamate synthase large subunit [Nitrospina sp.]MBT4104053.1 glutamate synthase large subunit [Nitrospina sp.]MBT4621781.1 glutamate synthase large subunit [Nitrospina sp.]MBT4898038.1 glutamate synthase large subunit [Nitrospina sp.]MBT5262090.1 glutamate synthase large subunit [Nitrospina sp.]
MTAFPKKQGLYDPAFEKDSCGVGFVMNMKGEKSHEIIIQGLEILKKLEHRGACGSDAATGDGAGILIQIPHLFFQEQSEKAGIKLPEAGRYAVGNVFLPSGKDTEQGQQIMERAVVTEGLELLGWRDVPVDNTTIGVTARSAEPVIKQIFVGAGADVKDQLAFERRLYCVRKRTAWGVRRAGLNDNNENFYVCSLSSKTLIYKGQLMAPQVETYYPDIKDPHMVSALALAHSRYSTNTFPSWGRAQPFRYIAHNGEINTVRGNQNWMRARESMFESPLFKDINMILPVIAPGGSDSADFDQALEMLFLTGRSLPHAMMMMIPEPWSGHETMDDDKRGFYEFHASMMEPWDGPASIAFTDGETCGAVLDRNGLRPSRYYVTKDGLVIMASEVGVVPVDEANIAYKGRLQPGKMFLVDINEGRIISDEEIKAKISTQKPYKKWVEENQINLKDLPETDYKFDPDYDSLLTRQTAFGYTVEDIKFIIAPMIGTAQEATGSMGNDTPLAVLSQKPQLLFHYFKQLFAQVTNPAIDSIREELVMSMEATLGKERNLLDESPEHCRKLKVEHPILTGKEMEKIRKLDQEDLKTVVLSTLFPVSEGENGLERALDALCQKASQAIEEGATILVLSDKGIDAEHVALPSLLATAGVHHHLLREGTRTRAGLVVETGEAREMMHFALLIGYGAGAIYPYLAYETVARIASEAMYVEKLDKDTAVDNFITATRKGLFKITAKMGISTIQSYRGAQIFEAVGLNEDVIEHFFTGTPSRVSGANLDVLAKEALARHQKAFDNELFSQLNLGGHYHWRRGEEKHMLNPNAIGLLQHATRSNDYATYKKFSQQADKESTRQCTLRGLFNFKKATPIPIEEVEPVEEITRRFCTGAMSIGSISREAHETLAIAMNRLGGRSNTGEGGEDPARNTPDANGDSRRSKIKQVASGRFGVNSYYLSNADEMQIKIAQGAKPGEGGQLPGHKVSEYIAKIRNSTPGVALISPPPHHDIYSIEDLQQLIFDLHNANPDARVSVKLVAEAGVGTIAAGVSKARAEGVLIAGHDGGTGASPQTSIKHAGLPWELGLSETQQILVLNDLRGRICVQVDGQLKTGRDVVIGGILGADEFGFSTTTLITMGCIMMRKCHLNTCSVGIATQDPVLRKKFGGKADYVVNFFRFIAEEVREIMAQLGIKKFADLIGKVELLEGEKAADHWKASGVDVSKILFKPEVDKKVALRNVCTQDLSGDLDNALDHKLIETSQLALEKKTQVYGDFNIVNTDRATGAMLSYRVSKSHGEEGLPADTIQFGFTGSAGQSFGAFLAPGITFGLAGDANDYVGKGLSGGKIFIYPPRDSTLVPEENILIGNTVLYGAISGKAFFRGIGGERFAVRNSGAHAVVEGVGDHGCEYMTGGTVVVLGATGRNFAAGMSGGLAYVLDRDNTFPIHCNQSIVDLLPVEEPEDVQQLKGLIEEHFQSTQSSVAKKVLDEWEVTLPKFVKIYPKDYRRVLEERKNEKRVA